MNEYFDNSENFARLQAELKRWEGTPFMRGEASCGRGGDCVNTIEQILVNAGAMAPIEFPPYTIRGGGAPMLETFIQHIEKVPGMTLIWRRAQAEALPAPRRGRLLLGSTGQALHHLAIIGEPPVVWHNLHRFEQGSYFDPGLAKRIHSIYALSA